jgi:hypothetical protein
VATPAGALTLPPGASSTTTAYVVCADVTP